VPIAVENISSYAEFHVSEMTEWVFLNEVVERADCGILLDVNNIYVRRAFLRWESQERWVHSPPRVTHHSHQDLAEGRLMNFISDLSKQRNTELSQSRLWH